MQAPRHYSKAPITEAIIDLRARLDEGLTGESDDFDSQVLADFPNKELIQTASVTIGPAPDLQVATERQQIGVKYTSADGVRVFQATRDGFTFNHLTPYDSWEPFRDEAMRLWQIYKNVFRPVNVSRVAVRYINRLELPAAGLDFDDYLLTFPRIGPDLPQLLAGFFMRLELPQVDLDSTLIINVTPAPSTDPNIYQVILDFDLFCDRPWSSDDEGIWGLLERLRVRKNEAFEASITDATRRLIT